MRRRFRALFRNLLQRDRVERELDDEMRSTIDLLVDEHIHAGMSPVDARRAARLQLGGIESLKDRVRDARTGAVIDSVLQDFGYALRLLRRTPLFTVTAVASLAIGIAGNAVVFSLADAYLIRQRSGIVDSHRLVEVGRIDNGEAGGFYGGEGFDTFSYPNYLDYRERQTVFDGLAAYHVGPIAKFGVGSSGSAARVPDAYVSANFFTVLGVPIALGRGFLAEEEQLANPRAVTVISHRLWQTQFGGDGGVIGRIVHLNGRPFTIVGVAAPEFHGYSIEHQNLWVPITGYPDGDDLRRVGLRGARWPFAFRAVPRADA